jgi:hypothetical protein
MSKNFKDFQKEFEKFLYGLMEFSFQYLAKKYHYHLIVKLKVIIENEDQFTKSIEIEHSFFDD